MANAGIGAMPAPRALRGNIGRGLPGGGVWVSADIMSPSRHNTTRSPRAGCTQLHLLGVRLGVQDCVFDGQSVCLHHPVVRVHVIDSKNNPPA
jgi:hypothetical protein